MSDLRYLDELGHRAFVGNVRSGLKSMGMPSFQELLSEEEVRAIQAYVIKRAHDEKTRPSSEEGT